MSGPPWGVRDLTVRFGRRTALDGVSLEVPCGAVTAVCGGDGAGKTTLLRALAGSVRPVSGRVDRPERSRIGYVAGQNALYTDLSVDENIAFVGRAYGLSGEQLATRRRELLVRTGLAETAGRLAGRLSGGMRQKLSFALAMLHEPELLILDEPTTGVDPVSRAELWRLIARAAAGGAAVVVSTSYPDEAERAASLVLLENGRMAAAPGPQTATASARPADADVGRAAAAEPPEPRARDGAPLAATSAVTRTFGPLVAVDEVDIVVRPGEVVGLIGANGAGKTTLIRLLLGLLRPTTGRVWLFGRAPSRATRGRIGYVPQALGLWEDLTVTENLRFTARSFGVATPELEPDLAALSDTVVRDLPVGLRRRLAFAAALAHSPDLLILDEPTSGVDTQARARLWRTVREAAGNGAGVLVTTHHMEEAGECDRLVVMAAGRVVADGTMAAIIGDRQAVAVDAAHWEEAFSALEDAGLATALVGRSLRVPECDPAEVRRILDARRLEAKVHAVPATFEEAFVALARTATTARSTWSAVADDNHASSKAPPTGANAATGETGSD